MKTIIKLSLVLSSAMLSACVNQNTIAQKKIAPVTNACQKVSALINAYDNNFEQIKDTKIKANVGKTWKAKYNLVGENCHIWSWGGEYRTYACNISADNEETASDYYQNAITTTKQCLSEDWLAVEEPRNNDSGKKITFSNANSLVTVSAHFVPLDSLFSKRWTVYYYIGKPKP